MKYYKLKISWEDAKNKLYRTCYIPSDLYLGELGYLLCILFKTKFEHAFMFTDHESIDYVDDSFDNEEEIIGYKVVKYKKVKAVNAIKKYPKLQFVYDLGDYYCFDLQLNLKDYFDLPILYPIILVDAKGDGIFEDNITGLRNVVLNNSKDPNDFISFGEYLGKKYNFDCKFDYSLINMALLFGRDDFDDWNKIAKEKIEDDNNIDFDDNHKVDA